jgi:hypothetical protein
VSERVHLGDGAYAHHDGYHLWIETQRSCDCGRCGCGGPVMHRVALEPEALVALVRCAVLRAPYLAEHLVRAAEGAR